MPLLPPSIKARFSVNATAASRYVFGDKNKDEAPDGSPDGKPSKAARAKSAAADAKERASKAAGAAGKKAGDLKELYVRRAGSSET